MFYVMEKYRQYRVLRGHHLLCVHGFQGMGYSPRFVERMTEIVKEIRNDEVDFAIQVVEGFDQACAACPNKGDTMCKDQVETDAHVRQLDQNVMRKLGISHGDVWSKDELVIHTAKTVEPDDLDELCANCSWLSYGVCKAGIAKLKKEFERADERTG
jgi:uncharacterized protein